MADEVEETEEEGSDLDVKLVKSARSFFELASLALIIWILLAVGQCTIEVVSVVHKIQ